MIEQEYMIKIENLQKKFGKKEVLRGIDLKIKKGEFYGVFGKNGMGKSTLFKHILGIEKPTKGNVFIADEESKKQKKVSIGYLPENVSLYGYLSVEDNLKVAALSAGFEMNRRQREEALEKVNLVGSNHMKAANLSLGMKRRLQFAMATMTKPVDILILDEPTNGMDVNGVLWLKKYLEELKQEQVTILTCSHSLNIMEDLIDRYCIIEHGKIIKENDWTRERKSEFIVYYQQQWNDTEIKLIQKIAKVKRIFDNKIILEASCNILELSEYMLKNNLKATDIDKRKQGLEEIFVESVMKND